KPLITASASKLSGINKAREADELRREREDARKKKEAILEAKREQQKKKREEKMAAAAAAREAAEKERRAAMEAAARDRMEKQAHADLGKLERLKEAERVRIDTYMALLTLCRSKLIEQLEDQFQASLDINNRDIRQTGQHWPAQCNGASSVLSMGQKYRE
ncbi:jg3592, partial [Pararge aegeria aegeria]